MKAGNLDINAGDVVRKYLSMTIRVELHGMRVLRFRLWLGTMLLRLGAAVTGIPTSISIED